MRQLRAVIATAVLPVSALTIKFSCGPDKNARTAINICESAIDRAAREARNLQLVLDGRLVSEKLLAAARQGTFARFGYRLAQLSDGSFVLVR